MEPPVKPYQGKAPFAFVCYSHKDTRQVYAAISHLAGEGVNVWYDEGIEAGSSWRDSLANAIDACAALIFFASTDSVVSEHCLKEVNFAVENGKQILVVYLEEVELPPGLRLYLGDLQHIGAGQSADHGRLTNAVRGMLAGRPLKRATTGRKRSTPIVPFAATLLLVLTALALWWWSSTSTLPQPDASVAVLPFDHWGEADKAYISDGIADEIMHTLSRLEGIRVAARGAAFSFRDRKGDIPAIGDALKVSHVVDGSVQRAGDRIKVTSYLIDTADGSILWSSAEESMLDNVFGIQANIASAVLNALKARVGLQVELEPEYQPKDAKAYDEFLLGKHLWRQRGAERIRSAIDLFQSAVERDPNFGRAWSALAFAYLTLPSYDRSAQGAHAEAELNALRALEVDPNQAEAHGVLASLYTYQGQLVEAGRNYRSALALEPGNPDLMSLYEEFAADLGHMRESLDMTLESYRVDPVNMRSNMGAGWALTSAGRAEEGIVHFDRAWATSRIEPVWRGRFIALTEAGRLDEAATWLEQHPHPDRRAADDAFLSAKRDPEKTSDAARVVMEETVAGRLGSIFAAALLASLGAVEETYELIAALNERGRALNLRGIWWHSNDAARIDPRLNEEARRRGMLDYWAEFGPPDACNLSANGDLECFR